LKTLSFSSAIGPPGQGLGKHAAFCHFHSAAFHKNNDPLKETGGTDSVCVFKTQLSAGEGQELLNSTASQQHRF